MMYATLVTRGGLAAVLLLLPGCRTGFDDLEPPLQVRLEQVDARLAALEQKPQLDFVLQPPRLRVEDKSFTPLLVAETELRVEGAVVPPTFYVDVLLSVTVDGQEIQERQIFPVVDGQSRLTLQAALIRHGLQPDQLQATLRPVAWYQGQVIGDERVFYR